MTVRYEDLESRGVLVVRSFLDRAEIEACKSDYRSSYLSEQARLRDRYPVGVGASEELFRIIGPKLRLLAARISASTDIAVTECAAVAYFPVEKGGFDWHSDRPHYFKYQDAYHYLNFWIPIVKPLREKSNLCVLPEDVMEPDLAANVRRAGALDIVERRGKHLVVDRGNERVLGALGASAESLAFTPELDVGDLLVLRGQILHRTQDTETKRVALSVRMIDLRRNVSRAKLAQGSYYKLKWMSQTPSDYEMLFRCFERAGRDELSLEEIWPELHNCGRSQTMTRKRFVLYLLAQKLRMRAERFKRLLG